MPVEDYGVWVGFPRSFIAEKSGPKPHLQLMFDDDPKRHTGKFRAAVNIKSSTEKESRLVYWFDRDFKDHPILELLEPMKPGWRSLDSKDKLPALDYIRGNLMDLKDGTILRHNVDGENNDIIDYISPVLNEAIKRKATIYIFGSKFPNGVHEVHMNQGNEGQHAKDNGVYQDGGIMLFFPDDQHWEAIFLAFAVQSEHTNKDTGDPTGNTRLVDIATQPLKQTNGHGEPNKVDIVTGVFIRAALVNPVGPDATPSGQVETVYLTNKTQSDINLDKWSIVNGNTDSQPLNGVLLSESSRSFGVPNCPLGNRGGIITLLDSALLKVDGVSYSQKQAAREGVLVYFK